MRRAVWFLLVFLLAAMAFAGGKAEGTSPAGAAGSVTLSVFINNSGARTDLWGRDDVSKYIIDKTGIQLTLDKPTADDNQKINLMVASGNLPDIIVVHRTNPVISKLIDAGLVYDWDGLIDKYAPDFKNAPFYVQNRNMFVQPDGKVYYFTAWMVDKSKWNDGLYVLGNGGYYIREDVWNELGKPEIRTTDDLERFLVAGKERHPEIAHPLLCWFPVGTGDNITFPHMSTLVMYRTFGGQDKYFVDRGVIKYPIWDPRYKAALLFINKLYRQGLINVSDFTDKEEQHRAVSSGGRCLVSIGPLWEATKAQAGIQEVNPDYSYLPIDWILAPGVEKFVEPAAGFDGADAFLITKSCKHPDRAIQFVQFMATDEFQALSLAGLEGKGFNYGGPGNKYIVPTEESAKLIGDWPKWQETYGGYLYNFIGCFYADSAFSWGFAITNPFKMKVYSMLAKTVDFSVYDGIEPDPDSPEHVIWTKFNGIWANYVAKVCLAKSEAVALAEYDELLGKARTLGVEQVEAVWNRKFASKQR